MDGGRLAFQFVGSPIGESKWSSNLGVHALLGEKDCVTGGLGQLLDAGRDVDRVTDQGSGRAGC